MNAAYPKLIEPESTKALMRELGFDTKKRFGQNFLIDKGVLERIMAGSNITKDDTVLEIGPGIGTMTQALSEKAGRVIAVEIDRDLIPILEKTLSGCDNVTVLNKDILEVDLQTLDNQLQSFDGLNQDRSVKSARSDEQQQKLSKISSAPAYKVVANLPYYITTPILMKLLESGAPISSITVMVQKEVADRMKAAPGGKDYGALSLAVQYYSDPVILAKASSGCFLPPPKVDSEVICLTVKAPEDRVLVKNPAAMFSLIHAAFSQRRKTLVNALKNDPSLKLSREQVIGALSKLGLDETIRGERLSVQQFAQLSNLLGP